MDNYNIENSYDIIKNATRGKSIDEKTIKIIINNCDLDKSVKLKLLKLRPREYIGLAKKLTLKKNR